MHLTQRKVVMEGFAKKGGSVTFVRAIENAQRTYHIARSWVDNAPHFQWKGNVTILGNVYQVWGYTRDPDGVPEEFANDTY